MRTRKKIHKAIQAVDWPVGSGKLTLYPQSGKKSGEGNGVGPIKIGFRDELSKQGWKFESATDLPSEFRPGPLDAVLSTKSGPVQIEWETGNISSSHRAINKLILGLMDGVYVGAVLAVPSREFARYLTDRVGNFPELRPYFRMWEALSSSIEAGVLEIVEVEYDNLSVDVPRMPKKTDGRALR